MRVSVGYESRNGCYARRTWDYIARTAWINHKEAHLVAAYTEEAEAKEEAKELRAHGFRVRVLLKSRYTPGEHKWDPPIHEWVYAVYRIEQ